MKKAYNCKHSVRYNATGDMSTVALKSVYISKFAVETLGNPETIVVEVNIGS